MEKKLYKGDQMYYPIFEWIVIASLIGLLYFFIHGQAYKTSAELPIIKNKLASLENRAINHHFTQNENINDVREKIYHLTKKITRTKASGSSKTASKICNS